MITIGGILIRQADRRRIRRCKDQSIDFMNLSRGAVYTLSVPKLTPKEKSAIDQLMPPEGTVRSADVESRINISFPDDELSAYSKHYKEYPVFGEIAI